MVRPTLITIIFGKSPVAFAAQPNRNCLFVHCSQIDEVTDLRPFPVALFDVAHPHTTTNPFINPWMKTVIYHSGLPPHEVMGMPGVNVMLRLTETALYESDYFCTASVN